MSGKVRLALESSFPWRTLVLQELIAARLGPKTDLSCQDACPSKESQCNSKKLGLGPFAWELVPASSRRLLLETQA